MGHGQKSLSRCDTFSIMAAATCSVLLLPSAWAQVGVILVAALIGMLLLKPERDAAHDPLPITMTRRTGLLWLTLFFSLLIGLPVLTALFPSQPLVMIDAFYRTGSLVFGGGHVVLPLLQAEVVPTGWVSNESFLAGYGAAQAVPGPLFTFAAFLGGSMNDTPSGWLGGMIWLLAIFTPSFLLVMGTLPFWESLRRNVRTQAALSGINAGVVGLLLAALYYPVWSSAIHESKDFAFALVALIFWKPPTWAVVVGSGVAGWLL
jgi:chromate transporter